MKEGDAGPRPGTPSKDLLGRITEKAFFYRSAKHEKMNRIEYRIRFRELGSANRGQ